MARKKVLLTHTELTDINNDTQTIPQSQASPHLTRLMYEVARVFVPSLAFTPKKPMSMWEIEVLWIRRN